MKLAVQIWSKAEAKILVRAYINEKYERFAQKNAAIHYGVTQQAMSNILNLKSRQIPAEAMLADIGLVKKEGGFFLIPDRAIFVPKGNK